MTKVNNLSSLLHSLETRTEGEMVSVREMLNAVGRRSYGPILLLLGFIAVSPLTIIPGATWLVAILTILIAGQILIGRKFPWIPSRLLKIEFPRSALLQGIQFADPYVCQVDRFLKPRLTILTSPLFAPFVALICIAAAVLTIPLGLVPFGPLLPGLTVLLFGLALTARDGFMLILAALGLAGAAWLLFRLWTRISAAFT
ncbi:MAG: exopolysaccharide biosynthesis protein [Hyphomonas sp.]|uniref:exopolysaccharide biosynthesis protein n=1 Tax=Hyphomonas sp. TaxID=87 RepID=UPI003527492C